ncbi:MAG: phenylacetate--CoA ligase family protein [Desulfobacterales bacterium]|nr:phenylacetate--CoA ligase family protein [Desulfobacterales bacterium]
MQESQWWSREKLEEYQIQQLNKLLHHAYKNVPYYKRVFDERGLKPKDIQNFDELRKLPYLTKDIVRGNLNDLIAQNIPKEDMEYVTTGGTSGKPLGFYIEKRTNLIRMAFEWREWNWMGYKFGDKCIVLRGNVIKREENGQKAWWEYDRENNYLILSTYDMTDENLPKYVQKIEEFKPKVIRGYPSALDILARFIRKNNLAINARGNIKAISTSSENLYPAQRPMIEETFKCTVFDKYGNVEQVTILGECEKHEGYHDFMEYSYTEILDKDGNPVTKDGEVGEIASTSFTNYATPFIRYKIDDLAEYTTHRCSCGRRLSLVKKIEGRWLQELIVTKRGNLISITSLNMHSDVFDNVRQFQFYQDTPDKIIFKVVKKNTYTEKDTEYIMQELQRKIKNQIDIEIAFVNEVPKTTRGKYQFLIQKLPIKFGD